MPAQHAAGNTSRKALELLLWIGKSAGEGDEVAELGRGGMRWERGRKLMHQAQEKARLEALSSLIP